jgi:hypothetical protein
VTVECFFIYFDTNPSSTPRTRHFVSLRHNIVQLAFMSILWQEAHNNIVVIAWRSSSPSHPRTACVAERVRGAIHVNHNISRNPTTRGVTGTDEAHPS